MARTNVILEITGTKARILKLILGTPPLLVGSAIVFTTLGGSVSLDALLSVDSGSAAFLFIGGSFGLAGVLLYLSALTNDEFAITQSKGSSKGP